MSKSPNDPPREEKRTYINEFFFTTGEEHTNLPRDDLEEYDEEPEPADEWVAPPVKKRDMYDIMEDVLQVILAVAMILSIIISFTPWGSKGSAMVSLFACFIWTFGSGVYKFHTVQKAKAVQVAPSTIGQVLQLIFVVVLFGALMNSHSALEVVLGFWMLWLVIYRSW